MFDFSINKIDVRLYCATILSILCAILFICGCWAYSIHNIRNVSWAFGSSNLGYDLYLGLTGYTIEYSHHYNGTEAGTTTYSLFSDRKITCQSFCSECEKTGKSAFALVLTCVFLSTILAFITYYRINRDSILVMRMAAGCCIILFVLSLAAFSYWNAECYESFVNDNTAGISDAVHGAGFDLVVVAWIFTIILFILHVYFIPTSGEDRVRSVSRDHNNTEILKGTTISKNNSNSNSKSISRSIGNSNSSSSNGGVSKSIATSATISIAALSVSIKKRKTEISTPITKNNKNSNNNHNSNSNANIPSNSSHSGMSLSDHNSNELDYSDL